MALSDEQVGTVSVRAIPDTRGFRQKLKAELEKIEKSLELTLDIGVQLSRQDLLRARRELKALEKGAAIKVRLELDKSQLVSEVTKIISEANAVARENPVEAEIKTAPWDLKEFTRTLASEIDNAVAGLEAEIPVELQDGTLRGELERLIRDADEFSKVEITADLNDTDFRRAYQELREQIAETTSQIKLDADTRAAQERLEGFLQQMRDKTITLPIELDGVTEAALQAEELARSRQLDIYAILHSARAASQIAVLTHSRTLDVRAHLRGSAVGKIAGLLGGLAGLRFLADISREVSSFVAEIDRSIPRITAMATAAAALSSVLIGVSGGMALFITGVGRSLRGLLLMPAAISGLAASFFILKFAFQDASKYVGDLTPLYADLRRTMSDNFWGVAERSIRQFTAAFIPLANELLPGVARSLGRVTEAVAVAFSSTSGMNNMREFLVNLREGLALSAVGFNSLTSAILNLVAAGSRQFPILAVVFNEWMESFQRWTARIASDGTFDRWMKEAGQATRDLSSIMASSVRIFLAFADAAKQAGSPSLSDMAASMRDLAEAAQSARSMEFLTTMFRGANQAMLNMAPGLRNLGSAFVDLAPDMARVMEISGDIVSILADGLATILSDKGLARGVILMFEALKRGAENLGPIFPTIGTDLGLLAQTVGVLAEQISRVLAVAAEELSTVFQDLMRILQDIIPVLGAGFIDVLRAIGPAISFVADAIAEFVDRFPRLSAAIALGVVALGTLITVIGLIARPMVAALSGFFMLRSSMGEILEPLANVNARLGTLGGVIRTAASFAARLFGWITVLVLALVGMWQNSDRLREAVGHLWQALKDLGGSIAEALAPAIERIGNESLPGLIEAFGALVEALGPVLGFLGDLVALIVEQLAVAIENLTPALVILTETLVTVFEGALNGITARFEAWSALLQGDWDGFWRGLGEATKIELGTLGEGVLGVLNTTSAIIYGWLDEFLPGWRERWNGMALEALTALAGGFGLTPDEFINGVTGIVNNVIRLLQEGFSAQVPTLQDMGANVMTQLTLGMNIGLVNLLTGIRTIIEAVTLEFQLLPSRVIDAVSDLGTQLAGAVLSWFVQMLGQATVGMMQLEMAFRLLPGRLIEAIQDMPARLISQVILWFNGVEESTNTGIAQTETQFVSLRERIIQALQALPGQLRAEANQWFAVILSEVVTGAISVVAEFATMPARIDTAVAHTGILLRAQANQWFAQLLAAVVQGVISVIAEIATFGNRAYLALSNAPGLMRDMGIQMMEGLAGGILLKASQVASSARSVVRAAIEAAHRALEVNSPSKVFMRLGESTGEGLVLGIEHSRSSVLGSMEKLVAPPKAIVPQVAAVAQAGTATAGSAEDGPVEQRITLIVDGRELHTTVKNLEVKYRGRGG